ncbi:bZIP transcription factor [Westerdykella ornata]|uniref:BZIP transcription factor n=1 Tax=Westerdykella ornata TaxID=318751 RepID=A0A6A6JB60_WESOR|nr:bZIP transcription factor [Westerdykella ornata]KAF2273413.1 bZIP transcription factor [Westerdykella ornata]
MSAPVAATASPATAPQEAADYRPTLAPRGQTTSSSSSSSSVSEADQPTSEPNKLTRPRLGSRKSSGTIIIPRDSEQVELKEEEYDDGDARTMSPRRSSEEIERMGQEARQALIEQAKALQQSLMQIVDRVEIVKSEHEKLEGGNKFLQSYIGELMQTSKITSVGAPKAKGKGKVRAMK